MEPIINPQAGKPATPAQLVNVPQLISSYYVNTPDITLASQRVSFGTSGHRGNSLDISFNEWHILAITQAICLYRAEHQVTGPLYLGIDTHALSAPAFISALEVLAANGVTVMIAKDEQYTPTPVVSHAILTHNRDHQEHLADGIVITPSHNPPHDGGFKYNPVSGGAANVEITTWIENKANALIQDKLKSVKRIPYHAAMKADTTHHFDYMNHYISDLCNVLDMEVIRSSNIHIGVDPLGGASIHYWEKIKEQYGLNLSVTNHQIDPTFRFMTVDFDGQIRMNPASPYAMVNLVNQKDDFDVAFACDTDADRHGIVSRKGGLIHPYQYFSVAIEYLCLHRKHWQTVKTIGKTVVTSDLLNRVTHGLKQRVYETPVGFKWFVDGLLDQKLQFCAEESAGATLCRLDGSVWTTDKDGIATALLAAEITACMQKDISDLFANIETRYGNTFYSVSGAHATPEQKKRLSELTATAVQHHSLAGDKIVSILTKAPGNNAPIGGIKVSSKYGWFVARPSGTESIYRLYAESFKDKNHLQRILEEAQSIIDQALKTKASQTQSTP